MSFATIGQSFDNIILWIGQQNIFVKFLLFCLFFTVVYFILFRIGYQTTELDE